MRTYGITSGLVGGIVPDLEVGVVKCLLAAHAARWVEAEHLRKQVDSERIRGREERREWYTRFDRQRSDIVLRLSTNKCKCQCRTRYDGSEFGRLHEASRLGGEYPLMGFQGRGESG
jgi:hypothetical protein